MYAANLAISNYLIGKGLTPVSSDYRFYYYEEGTPLDTALAELPTFGYIWYSNLWGSPS